MKEHTEVTTLDLSSDMLGSLHVQKIMKEHTEVTTLDLLSSDMLGSLHVQKIRMKEDTEVTTHNFFKIRKLKFFKFSLVVKMYDILHMVIHRDIKFDITI